MINPSLALWPKTCLDTAIACFTHRSTDWVWQGMAKMVRRVSFEVPGYSCTWLVELSCTNVQQERRYSSLISGTIEGSSTKALPLSLYKRFVTRTQQLMELAEAEDTCSDNPQLNILIRRNVIEWSTGQYPMNPLPDFLKLVTNIWIFLDFAMITRPVKCRNVQLPRS